jgi:hypothetical protein
MANVRASRVSEESMAHYTPAAILRPAGREFWVIGQTGYEDSATAIYEMTPTDVVPRLVVSGGGC